MQNSNNAFTEAKKEERASMTNIEFVTNCIKHRTFRVFGFREAIIDMRFDNFSEENAEFFKDAYFLIRGDADRTADRSLVLEAMVLQCLKYDLKEFFITAFKKERHLSTRLTAIRGYATYATELEITPLMNKLTSTLHKRSILTLYIEYERLRSKFGLPYLVEKYGYTCFIEAKKRLDELYDKLPEELKGYFTLDENGMYIKLLSADESKKRFQAFLHMISRSDAR